MNVFFPWNLRQNLWVILVESARWCGPEGHRNDDIETQKHSTFEIVGLAILNSIGDDQDRDGKSHSLD